MVQHPQPLSSPNKLVWFRNFFRPHFNDWVFGPIDRLVVSQDALVGFIFMACSVDYLAGFWWGMSTQRHVKDAYTKFIDSYFPQGRYDADGLYDSLRNGLVHMFTIKGKKYGLTHNNPQLHLVTSNEGQIILNAGDFRDDLVDAANRFFDETEADPSLLDKVYERYEREGFMNLILTEIT